VLSDLALDRVQALLLGGVGLLGLDVEELEPADQTWERSPGVPADLQAGGGP
jgi:hypothetical protein